MNFSRTYALAMATHLVLGIGFLIGMILKKIDLFIFFFWCIPHFSLAFFLFRAKKSAVLVSLSLMMTYTYIFVLGKSTSYDLVLSFIAVGAYLLLVVNFLISDSSFSVNRTKSLLFTAMLLFLSFFLSLPSTLFFQSSNAFTSSSGVFIFLFWVFVCKYLQRKNKVRAPSDLAPVLLTTVTQLIALLILTSYLVLFR